MTGPIRIPSPWDYLAQGLGQGIESYGAERQHQEQLAQIAQQNAMQRASILAQLGVAGMVPSSSLQGPLASLGINTPVLPTQAERRAKLLERPGGLEGATPEEYIGAGIEPGQVLAGKKAVAQMPSVPAGEKTREFTEASPMLNEVATRYVGKTAAKLGALTLQNMSTVIDTAQKDWARDRIASGMPQPTAEELSTFGKAAQELYAQQEELRIRAIAAAQGRMTPRDRQISELITYRDDLRQEVQNLQQIPGLVALSSLSDQELSKEKRPEERQKIQLYGTQIARYRTLIQTLDDISERLAGLQGLPSVRAKAAEGAARLQSTVSPGITVTAPAPTPDANLTSIAMRLRTQRPQDIEATLAQYVAKGRLTQQQADKIKSLISGK